MIIYYFLFMFILIFYNDYYIFYGQMMMMVMLSFYDLLVYVYLNYRFGDFYILIDLILIHCIF